MMCCDAPDLRIGKRVINALMNDCWHCATPVSIIVQSSAKRHQGI